MRFTGMVCALHTFFFDLDFGAVSEISDCPTNAGATTLDSDKSTAFELPYNPTACTLAM